MIVLLLFPLIGKGPWLCASFWTIRLWRIKFLENVDRLKYCYLIKYEIWSSILTSHSPIVMLFWWCYHQNYTLCDLYSLNFTMIKESMNLINMMDNMNFKNKKDGKVVWIRTVWILYKLMEPLLLLFIINC